MNYIFMVVIAMLVSALSLLADGWAVSMDRCPYCHGDLDAAGQAYFSRCRECQSIVAILSIPSPPSTATAPDSANRHMGRSACRSLNEGQKKRANHR
jgi:tRNA(Ile2) C34 agmatinyltransferase TiaS